MNVRLRLEPPLLPASPAQYSRPGRTSSTRPATLWRPLTMPLCNPQLFSGLRSHAQQAGQHCLLVRGAGSQVSSLRPSSCFPCCARSVTRSLTGLGQGSALAPKQRITRQAEGSTDGWGRGEEGPDSAEGDAGNGVLDVIPPPWVPDPSALGPGSRVVS